MVEGGIGRREKDKKGYRKKGEREWREMRAVGIRRGGGASRKS